MLQAWLLWTQLLITLQKAKQKYSTIPKRWITEGSSQNKHQSGRQNDLKATPNQAHQPSENKTKYKDNFDSELFTLGTIKIVFMIKEQQDL